MLAKALAVFLYEANKLCKDYALDGTAIAVLRDITLTIETGAFLAITGASGSGKSTLLNLMGFLDTPSHGSLKFCGDDIGGLGQNALAALRNAAIGFVFQSFQLLPRHSAVENVELPLIYGGISPKERRARAAAALVRVGLEHRLAHLPPQLSGGEQQRVAVARAIVNDPKVILADEPTGSLDTSTGNEIMDVLGQLHADGTTIVIVTHSPEVAARADQRIVLTDGRILDYAACAGC